MKDPTWTAKAHEADLLVTKLADEGLQTFIGVVVLGALADEDGNVSVYVDSKGKGPYAMGAIPLLAQEMVRVAGMLIAHSTGEVPLPEEPPSRETPS